MALINWCGFESFGDVNGESTDSFPTLFTREGLVSENFGASDCLVRTGTSARKGGVALEGHDSGQFILENNLTHDGSVEYVAGIAVSTNGDGYIAALGQVSTSAYNFNLAIQRSGGTYYLKHAGGTGTATTITTWAVPTNNLSDGSSYHEYQYWEFKFVLGTSGEGGKYEVRVDGAVVATNTSAGMNDANNYFAVGNTNNSSSIGTRIDDYYILDTTGSAPYNTYLGAIHIERLHPSGAGSSTGFTPSAGSNFQNVDDTGRGDDDTSYNSTSSTGDKDLFNMGDLQNVNGGSVLAVRQVTQARKDASEDTINLTPVIKSGATETDGDQRALLTGYDYVRKDYTANPTTSSAWTESEVNSLEAGYKSS